MINVTRSPINSSLTESFSGASTIRAYNMQPYFIQENERRIESHQICNYPEIVSNSWLFCRLEGLARYGINSSKDMYDSFRIVRFYICSILIVSTSLFAIIYRDTVNPGLVGLSLTYALTCQLDIFLLTR